MTLYKTMIFDCDGVLLNSNFLKSEAFYKVAEEFGNAAAVELVEYHKKNGGISRNEKFKYFLEHILRTSKEHSRVQELVNSYGSHVFQGLLNSEVCDGLDQLKRETAGSRWLVVSGGNQKEIEKVFKAKGICKFFDGGIFGNPRSKDEIFQELISNNAFETPAVYLGDSRYDHEVAARYGIDFVFVHGWTEVVDWKVYCANHRLESIRHVGEFSGLHGKN